MRGQCLCGKIKFHFSHFSGDIAHCHCSMCRKFSGAAFGTFGSVSVQDLVWESGRKFIKIFPSSERAERAFCSECGSSLYYRFRKLDAPYEIALGLLDEEPDQAITANIFCENRPEWPKNLETLPCFAANRVATNKQK